MNRWLLQRPAILRIRARNQAIGEGDIVHRGAHGAYMGQAPVEKHVPISADPAPGGFEAYQPTQGGGNPDRAASINAQRNRAQTRCHGCSRAAGGAARVAARSEERRVGKEGRSRGGRDSDRERKRVYQGGGMNHSAASKAKWCQVRNSG